jgi:hypothetical protein
VGTNEVKTIREVIDDVVCEICENYCKFPDLMRRQMKDVAMADALLAKSYCDRCPLNRLQDGTIGR